LFKKYDQKQCFLLPLCLDDFVPPGSPARTISEVVDLLDLSAFESKYAVLGQRAYDPGMMLKVLFYSYYTGVTSSRSIADKLNADTVYMYLSGMQRPDFRTLCRFRSMHEEGIQAVFKQIVQYCMDLEMVGLGNVSFDGTKIKANASRKRTKDMKAVEKEISRLIEESERVDMEEDQKYGDSTPYEMPPELRDPAKRREKLRMIKKKLDDLGAAKKRLGEEKTKTTNLTDPDARLMKTHDGFRPAYNCQAAVDAKCQVVVAASVVGDENDCNQLVPMIEQVEENTGELPWITSADSGYSTLDNYRYFKEHERLGLIPDKTYQLEKLGKTKYYPKSSFTYDGERDVYVCPAGNTMAFHGNSKYKGEVLRNYYCKPGDCALKDKCTKAEFRRVSRNPGDDLVKDMRDKLDTRLGGSIYKERMSTVEPVFGNIKKNKGFKEFRLRSLIKAGIEFTILCTVHDLGKIHEHLKNLKKSPYKLTRTNISGINTTTI
jgi:transposase